MLMAKMLLLFLYTYSEHNYSLVDFLQRAESVPQPPTRAKQYKPTRTKHASETTTKI